MNYSDDDDEDICVEKFNGKNIIILEWMGKKKGLVKKNEYICELLERTKLEIIQKDKVTKEYQISRKVYLFFLFIKKRFFECLRT